MYQLQNGTDITEFATRLEAITAAKALSVELKQIVYVVDPQQRERMAYQGGELESYTYETRAGKMDR
ncbi:MAG: hypothetical protein JNJ59_05560 [Deltaproteobacteria bacterium]|jgi:hypothetical protein|nr:hypothetical protein [Deltaproteobacteria bacterium]